MNAVVAERLLHCVTLIGERLVVVHIDQTLVTGEPAQPLVHFHNMLSRLDHRWAPGKHSSRRDGPDDHSDVIRYGQIHHRGYVVFDRLECRWATVAGNVICAAQNVNHGRLECDHILTKSHEHLGRSLATYAAVNEGLTEELRVRELPELRD